MAPRRPQPRIHDDAKKIQPETSLTEKEHRQNIRRIKEAIRKSRLLTGITWVRAEELASEPKPTRKKSSEKKRKLK
jgi:hypothetical protein